MAKAALHDHRSHYHADPRLDSQAAGEGFVDRSVKSCRDSSVADRVFVAS